MHTSSTRAAHECVGEGQREREGEEPNSGLDLMTLRSFPEPKYVCISFVTIILLALCHYVHVLTKRMEHLKVKCSFFSPFGVFAVLLPNHM